MQEERKKEEGLLFYRHTIPYGLIESPVKRKRQNKSNSYKSVTLSADPYISMHCPIVPLPIHAGSAQSSTYATKERRGGDLMRGRLRLSVGVFVCRSVCSSVCLLVRLSLREFVCQSAFSSMTN